jgi:hypothetical protein
MLILLLWILITSVSMGMLSLSWKASPPLGADIEPVVR